MKYLLFILCFSFFAVQLNAQKIKIKKDIVYIDDVECLKISGDVNNISFFDLEGNELFFLKFLHNTRYGALYNKITFINQKMSFTSRTYIYTKKLLINRLVDNFVLQNCALQEDKVANFVMKYDENIEYDVETIIIREETQQKDGVNVNINIGR